MERMKKGVCAALSLALAAGLLAGCGGGETDTSETGGGGGSEATPEYVYVAESVPVAPFTAEGRQQGFGNMIWTGGSFYTYVSIPVGDRTPVDVVTPEYEGQYTVYAPALYRVGLDGTSEGPIYTAEVPEDEDSYVNLNGYAGTPDGGLAILEQTSRWWSDAPEGVTREDDEYWEYYHNSRQYALKFLDAGGAVRSEIPLDGLAPEGEDDYFYIENFAVGDDGTVYLSAEQTIYALDPDGAELFRLELENWCERLLTLPDGGVACIYWGDNGEEIAALDPETKSLTGETGFRGDGYNAVTGGGDYDLYYTSGISLYGLRLDGGEPEKLLNWLDCDVNPDNSRSMAVLEDGRIVMAQSNWDSNYENVTNELIVLEKKPYDSVPHKETLTLATQYLNYNIRDAIIEFNRKNDRYRIEVRDYSEYNNYNSENEEDWNAGMTRLTTEIGAGNLPDILDLSGLPLLQLAGKGYLEDLYPLLDADASLSREDLLPSVLAALEVDGKLYTICQTFGIQTVVGAAGVVGDTPGWTYDEFNAALRQMPEGCAAFDRYVTREDMLRTCLALDGDSFVNWATGACSFDSEAFVKLLEYVKSFPAEYDWELYEYSEDDSTPARIMSGRQMLIQTSIYDFQDQKMYQAIFGGDATYIGYPTESGTGNMIQPSNSGYAITSKCKDKDAAWSFLRQFFTEDSGSGRNYYGYGLPVNKAAFEKKLEEAMTPEYRTDADGNFILDEDGNKIEVSQGGWSWGGVEIEFGAITREMADKLLEAVNSTTKLYSFDESIYDIVAEQAAAFFDGQKTAEETAKLIQSKAMIRVNEQL